MIFSNFSPIYSNNHTVNIARHKLPDMVTYAMLAAQRLLLRDFAWNNNSVQTVSRRKISTGSTLLGETTNPGWNERFPAGLVAQALLPVLAIAELIMSARAGRFRKPCRMNTYEKRGGWGPILQGMQNEHLRKKGRVGSNSPGANQNPFLPQLPRNHILARNAQATAMESHPCKKSRGAPPGKLMQHLKSS